MRIVNQHKNNGKAKASKAKAPAGLSARKVNDYLLFSVFLVLIGMAYIWNGYRAERFIKQREDLRVEVKSLKSRYLLRQATLGSRTRLSTLRDDLDSLGLYPLGEPAYKLVRGVEVPLSRLDTPRRNLDLRRAELQAIRDSLVQLRDSALRHDTCFRQEPDPAWFRVTTSSP
jgi:hypothetical protein